MSLRLKPCHQKKRDKARVDMLAGLIGQSVLGPMGF